MSLRLARCRVLKINLLQKRLVLGALVLSAMLVAKATDLDTIGATLLRATDATLLGDGIKVAHPEASYLVEGAWEVNPSIVGQPVSLFTYLSSDGSSSTYPNGLGVQSDHADSVAGNFYGGGSGVSPQVAHVDNYEGNYFYESNILTGLPIQAKIVNQSFIFGTNPPQQILDTQYDNYAAQHNVLFVSGAGNSGPPSAPATAYNGIGVGAYGGDSSVGPTTDNGRSKPDITVPAGVTSFSTPYVAGAATVLLQAALRGDGGGPSTTNAAADIRTLKALLLNGAIKPTNWTHTSTAPLDVRYGAGILNLFNSYKQLAAGKYTFTESTAPSVGGAHPPGGGAGNVASLIGWDNASIAGTVLADKVNHYYFTLPVASAKTFTFTSTLVWLRQAGVSNAKNLDLFLYDRSNSNLLASSVSTVDNVEHLFVNALPAGRYDLQVFKNGGLGVTGSETYALAFESFALTLSIAKSGTNVLLSWPLAPTGFRLESTATLDQPISWSTVTNAPALTNNQNRVTLPATASAQFFRLVRP